MREQTIVWRDDFNNVPLTETFVEQWGTYQTIFTSSKMAIIQSRGKWELGRFIVHEGEVVFRLENGVKLSVELIQQWAFLE